MATDGKMIDTQAETDLLAACLYSTRVCTLATERLSAADFYDAEARMLFEHVRELGPEVDIAKLAGRVTESRLNVQLMDMFDMGKITCYSAEEQIRRLHELAGRRELSRVLGELRDEIPGGTRPVLEKLLAHCLGQLRGNDRVATRSAADIIRDDVLPDMESAAPRAGIPTGLCGLDRILHGWRPGGRYLVGARPSVGKSTLLTQFAWEAVRAGRNVLFFSVEVQAKEFARVLWAHVSGVNSELLSYRAEQIADDQFKVLMDGLGELNNAGDILVNDDPALTLEKLASRVYAAHADTGIDIVFLDYLQRMRRPKARSEVREVGIMSNAICELAHQTNLPFVVACQLNRSVESREGGKPRLSDLRESGELEQDFDSVLLLWRDQADSAAEARGDEGHARAMHLGVGKNRFGRLGRVDLTFKPWLRRFEETPHV